MRTRERILTVTLCMLMTFLAACNSERADDPNAFPPGLKYNVSGLPAIEDFSETEYEDGNVQFSPVESAVWRHDGVQEEISADDPRLIRLLNFLAKDADMMQSWWRQGYVLEEEINTYLACDDAMLEVNFRNEEGNRYSIHGYTPKIVICGDSYILFVDSEDPTDIRAERYWPFAEKLPITAPRSSGPHSSKTSWGNDYWIDLLEYAGFVSE